MEKAASSIVKKLSPETLQLFSLLTKSTNLVAKEELNNPVYWKSLLEDYVRLSLPFQGDTTYWKILYEGYTKHVFTQNMFTVMYESGRYEYIYIAVKKGAKGRINKATLAAINRKDMRAIKLLAEEPEIKDINPRFNIFDVIGYAIDAQYDEGIDFLLPLASADNPISPGYIGSLIGRAATVGRVDYMELLYSKHPYMPNIFSMILTYKLDPTVKADVLRYYLEMSQNKHRFSQYTRNIPVYLENDYNVVSPEEVQVMIDSGLIEFDIYDTTSWLKALNAKSSYLIYKHELAPLATRTLLCNITSDSNLLRSVLDTITYSEDLISCALEHDNDSTQVLVEAFNVSKEQQLFLLNSRLGIIATKPLMYLCHNNNITVQDLEKAVVAYRSTFGTNSIRAIMKCGVSMKLVGPSIAFHTNEEGIDTLIELGFTISPYAKDLIRHNKNLINVIIKHMPGTSAGTLLSEIHIGSNNSYTFMSTAVSVNFITMSILKGVIPPRVIDWWSLDYGWIENIPKSMLSNPVIQDGIQQMKVHLQIRILYYSYHIVCDLPRLIRQWLILAHGLRSTIYVYDEPKDILVIINSKRYRIPWRALYTKYRMLDMFSSKGEPLTTIADVRKRRRELRPR